MLHAKGRASFNSRFGSSGVSTHAQGLHMGALQELVGVVLFVGFSRNRRSGLSAERSYWLRNHSVEPL